MPEKPKKSVSRADLRAKEDFTPEDMALANQQAHDIALNRFYETLSQDEITQSLFHSPDPRVIQLLEFMFDPNYRTWSFTRLCRECHLYLGDIVDAFKNYQLDLGIIAMAKHAPKILLDTAKDAQSSKGVCLNCQGTGEVLELSQDVEGEAVTTICPACMGDGAIVIPGHDKSRDLFFRTMGLLKAAPMIAQQINITPSAVPTVEEFVTEASKAAKQR